MTTGKRLPITFTAEPRIFLHPLSQKPIEEKISEERFHFLCPEGTSLPSVQDPIPTSDNGPIPAVVLQADLNNDNVDDLLSGYRVEENRSNVQLFISDGRLKKSPLAKIFLGEKNPVPEEYLRDLEGASQFCAADANQDGFRDILWKKEANGKREYGVLFNQLEAWAENLLLPDRWNEKTIKEALSAFREDWTYLTRRLEHYKVKYGVTVEPRLMMFPNKEEKTWQLQLQIGEKSFNFSQFADPLQNKYEAGMLLNGKDPEEFLNERLALREWNLALRFGAFTPFTFSVLGNTAPIGFVVGGEWVFYWKFWGVALEYDYGKAAVFPEALRQVESGDSINELPIREDLPIELNFHNFSATPLLHTTFFGPSLHTHLSAGTGLFYEHGTVKKKRFEIVPANLQFTDFIVKVNRSQDTYDALGPRGRIGASLEKGAFQLGLDLLFDLGLPLNGEFKDFDEYLLRGILSLTVGYRYF